MPAPLLSVQNLCVAFRMGKTAGAAQYAQAVGCNGLGVDFDIGENQTVALVGESGSGKSVSAMAIVGLLPDNRVQRGRSG